MIYLYYRKGGYGMGIESNKNFISVELYEERVNLKEMLSGSHTIHIDLERQNRLKLISKEHKIDKIFLVDKGHKHGKELHIITTQSCILIFNYESKRFITVLFARPNQLIRLYDAVGLKVSNEMLETCRQYSDKKMNRI